MRLLHLARLPSVSGGAPLHPMGRRQTELLSSQRNNNQRAWAVQLYAAHPALPCGLCHPRHTSAHTTCYTCLNAAGTNPILLLATPGHAPAATTPLANRNHRTWRAVPRRDVWTTVPAGLSSQGYTPYTAHARNAAVGGQRAVQPTAAGTAKARRSRDLAQRLGQRLLLPQSDWLQGRRPAAWFGLRRSP